MTTNIKTLLVAFLACTAIGTYGVVEAQGATDAQTRVSEPIEMSVEAAVPGVIMPSPVHMFTTVEEASEYIGFRPQMPKLLPVGVITLEKDILQVVYVYEPGVEPYYNQAGGAYIIYRSSKLPGDISGDHKIHKLIETERVDGIKVTFKGSDKMVYLASWMKDGQNHSLDFYRPVTRDVAKAMIRNIVEEKSHIK